MKSRRRAPSTQTSPQECPSARRAGRCASSGRAIHPLGVALAPFGRLSGAGVAPLVAHTHTQRGEPDRKDRVQVEGTRELAHRVEGACAGASTSLGWSSWVRYPPAEAARRMCARASSRAPMPQVAEPGPMTPACGGEPGPCEEGAGGSDRKGVTARAVTPRVRSRRTCRGPRFCVGERALGGRWVESAPHLTLPALLDNCSPTTQHTGRQHPSTLADPAPRLSRTTHRS